eukprot:TRINITY_DN2875_c0_g1_i1.p1 TRINITY_DN2875_c0_g1~~TRINITY_DN2875_c0_g1_i1.p1  ORF type:complete len:837 (-),score=274.32 TRINITY_DN2875_c0_g1_i1:33-2192(-)
MEVEALRSARLSTRINAMWRSTVKEAMESLVSLDLFVPRKVIEASFAVLDPRGRSCFDKDDVQRECAARRIAFPLEFSFDEVFEHVNASMTGKCTLEELTRACDLRIKRRPINLRKSVQWIRLIQMLCPFETEDILPAVRLSWHEHCESARQRTEERKAHRKKVIAEYEKAPPSFKPKIHSTMQSHENESQKLYSFKKRSKGKALLKMVGGLMALKARNEKDMKVPRRAPFVDVKPKEMQFSSEASGRSGGVIGVEEGINAIMRKGGGTVSHPTKTAIDRRGMDRDCVDVEDSSSVATGSESARSARSSAPSSRAASRPGSRSYHDRGIRTQSASSGVTTTTTTRDERPSIAVVIEKDNVEEEEDGDGDGNFGYGDYGDDRESSPMNFHLDTSIATSPIVRRAEDGGGLVSHRSFTSTARSLMQSGRSMPSARILGTKKTKMTFAAKELFDSTSQTQPVAPLRSIMDTAVQSPSATGGGGGGGVSGGRKRKEKKKRKVEEKGKTIHSLEKELRSIEVGGGAAAETSHQERDKPIFRTTFGAPSINELRRQAALEMSLPKEEYVDPSTHEFRSYAPCDKPFITSFHVPRNQDLRRAAAIELLHDESKEKPPSSSRGGKEKAEMKDETKRKMFVTTFRRTDKLHSFSSHAPLEGLPPEPEGPSTAHLARLDRIAVAKGMTEEAVPFQLYHKGISSRDKYASLGEQVRVKSIMLEDDDSESD